MKKNINFKEKAKELLVKLNEAWEKGPRSLNENAYEAMADPFPQIREFVMDFIHLVYTFDPKLPLNAYILDLKDIKFYYEDSHNEEAKQRIEYYMNYFINYLEEYYTFSSK